MATITINLGLTVQVESGPQISFSNLKEVGAYGELEFDVPEQITIDGQNPQTTPGEAEVDLQPSGAANVELLLIKPKVSQYPVENLKYIVSDGAEDPKQTRDIHLEEPHLYVKNTLALFATPAGQAVDPKVLKFTNEGEQAIAIEILVGRDPIR